MLKQYLQCVVFVSVAAACHTKTKQPATSVSSELEVLEPPALVSETPTASPLAAMFQREAEQILEAALVNKGAWKKLSYLSDHIGHRLSGSASLEKAVIWAGSAMENDGHEVRFEKVMVPHWVRGHEEASMLVPYKRPLHLVGLGGTVATPKRGLEGEVIVVQDFDDLEKLGDTVKGKIVLFNRAMPAYHPDHGAGYGDTVPYRTTGPALAAKHGAIAALVRSVTAHSLQSPHTGATRYPSDAKAIPAAALSVEDAELIERLSAGGTSVRIRLVLSGNVLPDAESANVIAEIRGSEKPEEIVLLGAHLDSWDLGQGAHDDGAGCVVMMEAITLLRTLGLKPKRTIRVVLFTNEENGLKGALAYGKAHEAEIPSHVMSIESDTGGFSPRGFVVQDNEVAQKNTEDIVSLLKSIGATEVKAGFSGADLIPLAQGGAPTLGLWVEGEKYFDYHHTASDTLDKVDPVELARNVGAVAVIAYIAANMPERFGGPYVAPSANPAP